MRTVRILTILAAITVEASLAWGKDGLTAIYYSPCFNNQKIPYNQAERKAEPEVPYVYIVGDKAKGVSNKLFWVAKWYGSLVPPKSGEYVFRVQADDGALLVLDGNVLIDLVGGRAGRTADSKAVTLEAGKEYPIVIDFYQVLGVSILDVQWKGPGDADFSRIGIEHFRPDLPLSPVAVTKVRFFPAKGQAAAMVGGRFSGSLTSPTNDFVPLAVIEKAPTEGEWNTIEIKNPTPYRYVKYEGPRKSWGAIAELEFYNREKKLTGEKFGTAGSRGGAGHTFEKALDGNTDTYYEGADADNQYVGLDLGAGSQTVPPQVGFLETKSEAQVFVKIDAPAGCMVRYTTDGSSPDLLRGEIYIRPFSVTGKVTIAARAFDFRLAPSDRTLKPVVAEKEMKPGLKSYHSGNSLMGGLGEFIPVIAASLGYKHDLQSVGFAGAPTDAIWKQEFSHSKFMKEIAKQKPDVYLPQPFSRHNSCESLYETLMFQEVLKTNPKASLYVYMQWPAAQWSNFNQVISLKQLDPKKDTLDGKPWVADFANLPLKEGETISDQGWLGQCIMMPKAKDWAGAMTNYARYYDLLVPILRKQFPDTKVAVVPSGLVLKEIYEAVMAGKMPGVDPKEGADFFFCDGLHLNPRGQYVTALTHFACLYGISPVGASSAGSGLTPEQAEMIQNLTWKIVTTYPLSPVYQAK